jgi:hypothetical protein
MVNLTHLRFIVVMTKVSHRKEAASEFMSLFNLLQERITSPSFDPGRIEKESMKRERIGHVRGPRGKLRIDPKVSSSRKPKLRTPVDSQAPLSEEQLAKNRKIKADLVRTKAIALCNKFRKLVLGGGFSYYLHSLEHHLADHIEACPIDIFDCSGSGVEKLNQRTKRTYR